MKKMPGGYFSIICAVLSAVLTGTVLRVSGKGFGQQTTRQNGNMDYLVPLIEPETMVALNPTADQESSIKVVIANHRADRGMLGKKVREARDELREEVMRPRFDQGMVDQRAQALIEASSAATAAEFEVYALARGYLTPEQIKTCNSLQDRIRSNQARHIPELPLSLVGEPVLKSIRFTKEQDEERIALLRYRQEENSVAHQQLFRSRAALERAILSDDYDESLVSGLTQEYQVAQASLIKLQVTFFVELRRIMTPRQIDRFMKLSQNERGKFSVP
jgi:Spy/CpxP family protein refolding chaperone